MEKKFNQTFGQATLDCVIQTISKKHNEKAAIIFEDETITYKDLYEKSRNLALHLLELGIKKDDKVAILLSNKIEYLYTYFGLFLIGAWATPLSTRYEASELKNVLENSDASTIIYEDRIGIFDYNKILADLKSDLPQLKNFIQIGEQETKDVHNFQYFLKPVSNAVLIKKLNSITIKPDDVALLAYTSGTTGAPKGVMIPHKNLAFTSFYTAEIWNLHNQTVFSVAPLYAAQGFLAVLIDLVGGLTMKWLKNFNPNDIAQHLVKAEATVFHTQPTMWNLLLALPYFKHLKFDSLEKVIVSGSLCPYNLAKRIEESLGCKLYNAYGLIEATGVVTLTVPSDSEETRLNTVGRPLPGVELKIVDKDRSEVPKGEPGELAIRGFLMKGYYKNEAKTKEVIDDEGWLYSGDMACFYDNDNISIVGRCKDMVIRGGFNVYPIDIEECLLTNDKIEDVSVVGKDDEILGESLVAFVIPKPDVELTESEVKQFCRGKISNYKIPDEVNFVSQLPILLSGKVQKNVLREWAVDGVPGDNKIIFDGVALNEM